MHRVLEQFFIDEKYESVEINIEDLKVFIKADVIYSVLDLSQVDNITQEQMNNMFNQLYKAILEARSNINKSVIIACSEDVEYVSNLYMNMDKKYDIEEAKILFDINSKRVMQERDSLEEGYKVCNDIVNYLNNYVLENGIEETSQDTKTVLKKAIKKTWAHLMIINTIIFLVLNFVDAKVYEEIMMKFSLNWRYVINNNQWYRIFTSTFLHWSMDHLFNNMISLWAIGSYLEEKIGRKWVIISYFVTGIIAGLVSMGYNMKLGNDVYSAGASGAIFGLIGMLLAVLVMARNSKDKISGKRLLIYVFIVGWIQLSDTQVDNAAHIGGLLAGIITGIIYTLSRLHMRRKSNE